MADSSGIQPSSKSDLGTFRLVLRDKYMGVIDGTGLRLIITPSISPEGCTSADTLTYMRVDNQLKYQEVFVLHLAYHSLYFS